MFVLRKPLCIVRAKFLVPLRRTHHKLDSCGVFVVFSMTDRKREKDLNHWSSGKISFASILMISVFPYVDLTLREGKTKYFSTLDGHIHKGGGVIEEWWVLLIDVSLVSRCLWTFTFFLVTSLSYPSPVFGSTPTTPQRRGGCCWLYFSEGSRGRFLVTLSEPPDVPPLGL